METQQQVRQHSTRTRTWHFIRHFAEMVAAMLVGMVVLGLATEGVLALTGLDLPASPEFASLKMAFDMAVGMVVWMRFRGHGWASTLEMSGVMFLPPVALFPVLWLGLLSADTMHLVEHVLMLPLMLAVMLRRRTEFGG
ncbi:hypothetical protein [Allonocardiopsis opalescens]|uniref:Flagellar biosynthetic protein FliP n=1 Tax=Allonocardiopsis opalescens TaxID=1144618 RepID=A0A2T0PZ02_9ACTN|nr:hypothetical protein [Allonocardiopsis opalescens]PRX96750.1 hypothetical protein CLV72_107273 [Allonocardiopsis opalescens]